MPKNTYVDGFVFSAIAYLQRAPTCITDSSENVPDSRASAVSGKYYHLFKKRLKWSYRKSTHS